MKTRLTMLASCFMISMMFSEAFAANISWTNGNNTNLWSDPLNWSSGSVPSAVDVAIFNGVVSNANCNIDLPVDVRGIDANSTYTGTITQQAGQTITVGISNFLVNGGTFIGGDSNIDINQSLTINGNFTATSATMTIAVTMTVNTLGTFNPNNGTVEFDGGSSGNLVSIGANKVNFFNLNIRKTSGSASTDHLAISANDTAVIQNQLTIIDGQMTSGIANILKDMEVQSAAHANSTSQFHFTGSNNGTLTINQTSGSITNFRCKKDASATLNLNSTNPTFQAGATNESIFVESGTLHFPMASYDLNYLNITITGGIFSASSGTIRFAGNYSNNGGRFLANDGTFTFDPAAPRSLFTVIPDTFYNVVFQNTHGSTSSDHIALGGGDSITVSNKMTLLDGHLLNGAIMVLDTAEIKSTAHDGNTTHLIFKGNEEGNFIVDNLVNSFDAIHVAKDNGTILNIESSNPTLVAGNTTETLNIESGICEFPMAMNSLNYLNLNLKGGIFRGSTGTIEFAGNYNSTDGRFDGNGGVFTFKTGTPRFIFMTSPDTMFNVIFHNTNGSFSSDHINIGSGDTLYAENKAVLRDGQLLNGVLAVLDTFIVEPAAHINSTTHIVFEGDKEGNALFNRNGNVAALFRINKDEGVKVNFESANATLEIGNITETVHVDGGILAFPMAENSLDVLNLLLNDGELEASSGNLRLAGNYTSNNGRLNPNGGTIIFDPAFPKSITMATPDTFHNVIFQSTNGSTSSDHVVITSGDTLYADNKAVLLDGHLVNGVLAILDTLIIEPTAHTSTTTHIVFEGDKEGNALFNRTGNVASVFRVNKDEGVKVNFESANPTLETGNTTESLQLDGGILHFPMAENSLDFLTLNLNSGELLASSGNLRFPGNYTSTNGRFNANGGTFHFDPTFPRSITMASPDTMFNVVFQNTNGSFSSDHVVLTSGDTLYVENKAIGRDGHLINGTLVVLDTLQVESTFHGDATTRVVFQGNKEGNYIIDRTGDNFNNYVVNKDEGVKVNFESSVNAIPTDGNNTQTLEIHQGTIAFPHDITNLDYLTLNLNGGVFDNSGNTVRFAGNYTSTNGRFFGNNGTFVFDPSFTRIITMASPDTMHNVIFQNTNGSTSSDNINISSGDTLYVTNKAIARDGQLFGGILSVLDTFQVESTFHGDGSTRIVFQGATEGNYIIDRTGDNFAAYVVDKEPGTKVNFESSVNAIPHDGNNSQTLTINKGTIAFPHAETNLDYLNFDLDGGVFDGSGNTVRLASSWNSKGGKLNANNGTIIFDATLNRTYTNTTTTLDTFNHVFFANTNGSTFNDNFIITSGDTILVGGDVAFQDGEVTGGTISAFGNVSALNTFFVANSKILFQGENDQSLNLNAVTSIFNGGLVIAKPTFTNVVLQSPVLIDQGPALVFEKGKFKTTTTNLLEFTNITWSGANDSSFVDGPVKTFLTTTQEFPVGKGSVYAPFTATSTSNTRYLAEYFRDNPDNIGLDVTLKDPSLERVSQCEYWTLQRLSGTFTPTITLSHDNVRSGGTNAPQDLRVARWNGSTWKDEGSSAFSTSFVTSSGTVGDVGTFTLASTSVFNPLAELHCAEDELATIAICKDITVQLDATGNATITPAMIDDGSYSVCGIHTLSLSKTTFTCADVGMNTVTLNVEDSSGTITTCTATVTVEDNINPNAVCQNITVTLGALGNVPVTITPSQIDNGSNDACGIANLALSQTTFDCNDLGVNPVILTVTDNNGNVSTCNATVTVIDDLDPVVFAQDFTVNLGASGTATISTFHIDLNSFDNCGFQLTLDKTTFTCADVGANTVTLTGEDLSGNTASATATVTVIDNTPPAASCQNLTVQLDALGQATITPAMINNGSSDICGIASLVLDKTNFDCNDVGANTVTLTVTDNNSNVSTCTATVTVEDNTNPNAICQNITVQLDATGNATIAAAQIDNGSNDACGIASLALSKTSFDCNDVGANTVTLTVTDNNSNVSTCTATVTVEDNINPNAICQNLTVQLDATGNATITPAMIDNGSNDACGIANLALSQTTFDCNDLGVNPVILTVTDNNGNVSTCNATVTVIDDLDPVVFAQDFTVNLGASGTATISTFHIDLNSFDNCGFQLTLDKTTFTCADVGANTVTLTGEDLSGNTASATATVTVVDNTPPTASCQNLTVQLDALGQATITPAMINNGSSDICGISSLVLDKTNFDCNDVGANTVTLTVTDNNSNVSTCTATVTVEDNQAPVISNCPSNITETTTSGSGANVSWIEPTAADNCTPTLVRSHAPGILFPIGTTTVTYTASDGTNSVTCTFDVTVIFDNGCGNDITAPVPDIATLPTINAECDATLTAPTASDNCSGSITATTTDPTSYNSQGTFTVTWNYDDGNGNTSSQMQTVVINDITAPVPDIATLPNITAECGATLTAPTASDNCLGSITGTTTDPTVYNSQGTFTVTWNYDDGNGNSSSQSQTVVINDITAPVPDIATLPTITAECGATLTAPTATDNCSGSITATTIDPTSYNSQGTFTVTWNYDDGNGNTSSQMQTVVINDITAPVPDIATLTTINAECGTTLTAPTASDNCSGSIAGTTSDPTSYNSQGTFTVTWNYDDGNGNTSSQSQMVVIDDITAPVPDVATLTTINAECGTTLTAPTATDNCSGSITATTIDPTSYNSQGTFTVTWNYDDGNGNTSSQMQTVVINDITAPVPDITNLPTINAECDATLTAPTASDNCSGSITGTTTDATSYNSQGTFTVTWNYDDGNGNTSSQSQTVVINDVTAPIISGCPANITISTTSPSGANVSWTAPTATDNCGNATLSSSHNPGDLFPIGVTTVTYTADDGNGNTATCSFDIQVENGGTGCGAIPAPWTNGDVGNVGITGSACYNPSTDEWTVEGSGKRIGGKKDEFHFVWQECDGDMDIIARVTSQSSSHNHAKAGIMIRQSLNKKSKNAAVLVRPNSKTNFQCRVTNNGQTYSSTVNNTPMAHWVRITRVGNQFTAYESVDGENWNVIGSEYIDMSGTVYIGMAVTSKNNNQLNVATMDNVSVNCGTSTPICGDLPSGWSNQDVGNVNIAGSACYDDVTETYHVKSSGYDIYHKKDKFHYVWQDMCGNGEIIAKVEHLTYTSSWALGGIMMRKSLSNKSKNVSMLMRAGGGSVFQVRYQHNKHTYYIPSWASAPKYIKLAKWNNLVCAYVSNDGSNWYGVGYTYIGLGQCFKVGLAVTSHNNSALNHTIFSNVEINSYGNGNSIPNLDDMPLADENMPTSDVRAEEFTADADLNDGSSQPNITTNSDDVSNLETPTELTINAFPNPFQNHLNLAGFVPKGSGQATITVMTIDGKVVYEQQNFATAGNRFNETLELNTLATGIYLLKIQTDSDVKVIKVNKVF